MTITKKDLAQAVAEAIGTRKLMALYMVDSLFETMREMLSNGQRLVDALVQKRGEIACYHPCKYGIESPYLQR